MSTILLRIAVTVTRAWTRLYTIGIPEDAGRSRRDQVASDLWEQTHDATDANAVAFSILGRLVRGMPDDLVWRFAVAPRAGFGQRRIEPRGGGPMRRLSLFPFFVAAALVSWSVSAVLAVAPVSHSLAFTGAALGFIALAGWALEARESEAEASPSAWPLLLAVSLAAIAGGLTFAASRLGLVLIVPMALGFTAMALHQRASRIAHLQSPAVTPEVIRSHARAGAALAVERPAERRVSRRAILRGSVWLGLGGVLASTGGVIVDFLWQRNAAGFGGVVPAGHVSAYPPGTKTKVTAGKFWLVHLTEDQGGPGFLALWQKCPHLGCTVPWEPGFSFTNKTTGSVKRGWFRCPCHQSTYDDAGVRVYGPAPRSMDRMALTITPDGNIEVDTATIEKGDVDNASHAVRPPGSEA